MLGLITAPVVLVNTLAPVAPLVSAAATPFFTSPDSSPTCCAISPPESINPSIAPLLFEHSQRMHLQGQVLLDPCYLEVPINIVTISHTARHR